MEIEIQLADVQLGPFSERQVREYLAEGLLTSADPARLEGTEAWNMVGDVLAKLALSAPPATPTAAPPEKMAPVTIPPQVSVASPTVPIVPSEVGRAPLTASTSSIPHLDPISRDTIRVPLPELTEALAKQTTQSIQAAAIEVSPLASKPLSPAVATTTPLPDKPSDLPQSSLPTAEKGLAKKMAPDVKSFPVEQVSDDLKPSNPATVPIPLPKLPGTARTSPLSMGKSVPPQAEADDTAKTVEKAPGAVTPPTLPVDAPKPQDKEQPPLQSEAKVPAKKAEADNRSMAPVRALNTPKSSEVPVSTSKSEDPKQASLPTSTKAVVDKPDETGTKTIEGPSPTETVSAPGALEEAGPEAKSVPQSSPFVRWLKSFAGKFGGQKPMQPVITEPPPEVVETKEQAPEVAVKAPESVDETTEFLAKVPEPRRKSIKLVRRMPEPANPADDPVKSMARALTTSKLVKPTGPALETTKPAEKTPGPSVETKKSIENKTPEPSGETTELVKKSSGPVDKELEPKPPIETAQAQPVAETESLAPVKTKSFPRGAFLGLVGLAVLIGLSLLVVFYVKSSYAAADTFLKALQDGDQAQLASDIDFPSVRQALTDDVTAQVAKSGGQDAATHAAVTTMIKNSIDYYVTPEALAVLATKSGNLPEAGDGPKLSPSMATAILSGFNQLSVKDQSLVSFNRFVIDLEAAQLDLQFDGSKWKLIRIELKPDFQLPQDTGTAAAPQDLGASLEVPVIETYLEEGKAGFQKGDWDGAIAAFSQVLAIDPKQTIAYGNRGMARKAKGDLKGALEDFTQAISLDPNLAGAYFNRAEVKAAQNDPDGALADYTQALTIDPKMGMAYYQRGGIRTLKSDHEGALADYTQVIAINPNFADAYRNRGKIRRAQNDLDGALADFTQALAINPKLADAYYNRGLAKLGKADPDGAILDFNQALELDPKLAGAYYNRGVAKNTKNDSDGAVADFNQALALDPKLASALADRAVAKQTKGDLNGAMSDFNEALALDPKIADAYYDRGLIKEQLNDLDGAIADSSHALELDPKRAQAYYNRGFAKLVKGNLDGARADLQKFCEMAAMDSHAANARLYLWLIAMAQNPKGTANQDLSDALQHNWSPSPDDLVTKIAGFLLGQTTEADLIAAASSPSAKNGAGALCEVWYFAGMKRLLAGDKPTAIGNFRKCVATGQKDYCEYILAQAELQMLAPGQDGGAPAK